MRLCWQSVPKRTAVWRPTSKAPLVQSGKQLLMLCSPRSLMTCVPMIRHKRPRGSINAFWTDMADYRDRITLVTMTEFGRRLQQNTNNGTDHGSASGMLVLSGNVNGGKIYGDWPGLAPTELNNGDLAVTTDYRQVLSEILVKRHGETNLDAVFPTVQYAPLGIMKG